jgi:predicted MFS family arabinose efflux permease
MESRDDGSPHNNAEITGTSNAYPIRKLSMPHPLGALRIVFYKDTFLALWTAAVVYAVWYCIQTILPVTYGPIYQFNELEVGLSYLAGGTGVIAGGIIAGKLMDWNYRVIAGKHGLSINQSSGDDIRHFPIEEARSRGCYAIFALYLLEVVGLGWVIQYKVHCSVPLILQFLIGAHGTIIHQTFNALLVDIFPENASTAAAAGNITRCGLAAALVAAMQPLVSVIGHGFFFTLVGLLGSLSGILAIILLRLKGREWRRERNKGSPLDSTELVPESENKR